jgi:hypothetical protein
MPAEALDTDLADWYRHLLGAIGGNRVREGDWRLLEVTGWPDNGSCGDLLAWSWTAGSGERYLVVINFSGEQAQGRVQLGWPDLAGRGWRLEDLLGGGSFERGGDEMAGEGLYVDLPPWQFHLVAIR